MGALNCCAREELQELPDHKAAAPAPETPLQVEDAPKRGRTSVALGRSVSEQLGFQVYEAGVHETRWLYEAVDRLWEYIESSIRKLLLQDITNQIRENCADVPLMKTFAFTECAFGRDRLKFTQLKVRSKGNLLEFFIEVDWTAPHSEIAVSLGALKLGMSHLQLRGSVLLVLSPLLQQLPLLGGLSVTFPDPPELTWTWSGAAGMGLKGLAAGLQATAINMEKIIVQGIFESLVVPSRIYLDIGGLATSRHLPYHERIENYRSPDPIGVLQITVLEARSLPAADFSFAGGSSDPYVVVRIGQSSWQTAKRHKTLAPVWGPAHCMDFLVYHMEQRVFVDIFDSDLLSFDDLLGHVIRSDGLRPRVSDLVSEAGLMREKDWDVQNGASLRLRCRFRELSEQEVVTPCFVECAEHGELLRSSRRRACALCGESSGGCWGKEARECPQCRFRSCRRCLEERRPASALLRVCFKEGLVPGEDAAGGVALGMRVEGQLQWCGSSERPRYDLAETQEAAQWIRNLCRQFDRASVAKCLEISLEQIQEVLSAHSWESQRPSQLLKHEAVIWDRALHFLVRDPSGDMWAELVYKGRVRKELSVQLLPKSQEAATSLAPVEMTWPMDLGNGQSASVFAEVTLTGLVPV